MKKFVGGLVAHGLAYPSPTSEWPCAPLHVPKLGSLYCFTVHIQPVNVFIIKHHYPLPNLKHGSTEVKTSAVFANSDLSQGQWQLLFALQSQKCLPFIARSASTRPPGSHMAR